MGVYNVCKAELPKGGDSAWDMNGDTFKAILLRSDSTYDPEYIATRATLVALLDGTNCKECDDTGYSRQTLTGVAYGVSGNTSNWKANKATFVISGTTQKIAAAVIYNDTIADDPPVAYIPLDDTQLTGKDVVVYFNDTDGVGIIFEIAE